MSPQLSFDPMGYDFIIVRNVGGFCRLEPWKLEGRLEDAMHGVVEDLFNSKEASYGEGEFGNLRLAKAEDRSELADTVQRAFRAMHGKMEPDRITDVMEKAREKIVEHDRERGRR